MKKIAISLFLILIGIQFSYAQEMAIEKEIKALSKAKWQ